MKIIKFLLHEHIRLKLTVYRCILNIILYFYLFTYLVKFNRRWATMLFMSSKGLLPPETPPLLDVISLFCLTADDVPATCDDGLVRTTDALSQISNNAFIKKNLAETFLIRPAKIKHVSTNYTELYFC